MLDNVIYFLKELIHDEKIVISAKYSIFKIVPVFIMLALFILSLICIFIVNNQLENSEIAKYISTEYEYKLIFTTIFISGGLLSFYFFIFALMFLIDYFVCVHFSCLCMTNKRLIGKVGFFSIREINYPISKIDNITITAGFFGTIFKYYTIQILSGNIRVNAKFKGITNAHEFKNYLMKAIDIHKKEEIISQAKEFARASLKFGKKISRKDSCDKNNSDNNDK